LYLVSPFSFGNSVTHIIMTLHILQLWTLQKVVGGMVNTELHVTSSLPSLMEHRTVEISL